MTHTKPQLRKAGAKRVAGLALRTDNATEAGSGGKIPGLWQRYRSEDWFGRLEELGGLGAPKGRQSASTPRMRATPMDRFRFSRVERSRHPSALLPRCKS